MHLKRITLKGFKSFPDRTRLDFAPGVSVIVGPNGSGKSNVTDAVLWALGEQSPLAVRGQTMQDVIFAGTRGVSSRSAAEVEVVLDNPEGLLDGGFSEISIARRLSRDGEGEYRLNGARCRLVDVIEVLSDTGLGREMHSVVSQGRVEAIVHSKPRDRRLLIEEAAGLGKHRKRRRRAQLKLERTAENVARVLDVEREARSRLRPLKRQAEAAELHERLRNQQLELRLELVRDVCGEAQRELAAVEAAARDARLERDSLEERLAAVAARRERAEEDFASHSRAREALSARAFAARSAADRIAIRRERTEELARRASSTAARLNRQREVLSTDAASTPESPRDERIAALEDELARLEARLDAEAGEALASLRDERDTAGRLLEGLDSLLDARRRELEEAEAAAERARADRVAADRAAEAAAERAATARAELLTASRLIAAAASPPEGARSLAAELSVEPGYELPVAAVLGSLGGAALADSLGEAGEVLDAARAEGGSALVVPDDRTELQKPPAPVPGARPLLEVLEPSAALRPALARVLHDAWLVPSIGELPEHFSGVAVTREGRAFFAATGEVRQVPATGEAQLVVERARHERLRGASAEAKREADSARDSADATRGAVIAAIERRDQAEGALREAQRDRDDAAEAERRAAWLIERGGAGGGDGPDAVRRAEVAAELRAERRLAEQSRRARSERAGRIEVLARDAAAQSELALSAERAAAAMAGALEAVAARGEAAERELAADEQRGEATAAELRACAREEAEIQSALREAGEAVTSAEVRAQQVRDAAGEAEAERREVTRELGREPDDSTVLPLAEQLDEERRSELEARVERLARRREQLGPVNPLAAQEYEEAVAHVEDLEKQRSDLESAMAELRGLVRETDRRIRQSFEETFEAAARNFEDVAAHLFPGGRGRLRLVQPEGPRTVLGGEEDAEPEAEPAVAEGGPVAEDEEVAPAPSDPGVEIEVTPAGKATKRLSLMSGGEKSLVALAFLFAVFLARPCPFYILDEVEAALDDANIDRFLQLLRRYCDRAQFIVVTHQRRTMDAADCLYGVSMGGDGISKVVSRRLPPPEGERGERRFEPAAADPTDHPNEVRAA